MNPPLSKSRRGPPVRDLQGSAPPSEPASPLRSRSPWLILLLLVSAFLFVLPHAAEASHFRYANLSYSPTGNPGQVKFNFRVAIRGNFFSPTLPAVGSIMPNSLGPFEFGDNTTTSLRIKVVATSATENWIIGDMVDGLGNVGVTKTYSGGGPYLAGVNICCRINYQNGGETRFLAKALVRPFSGNNSPVSSMVPVLYVPKSTTSTFWVPATDPDGDGLRFRMATQTQSGAPGIPNMVINPATGQVTWNNAALPTSLPYMAQFIIEDLDLNGNVKSFIPVECVVWISTQAGVAPDLEIHTHMQGQPEHGPITVTHGTPVSFNVEAYDVDPGATVTLNTGGLPQGATMTPTLPVAGGPGVTSAFSWTPAKLQVGTYVISYSVIDNTGFQTLGSITVNVIATDIIATGESYSIGKNAILNIPAPGVLANDMSEDNSPLTAILVSNPAQGSLSFNPDGSFSYTPNGQAGSVSFNYRATDGVFQSNPATVQIQILNAAPVANAGADFNAVETQTVSLDGSLSFDADGDVLIYSWLQIAGPPVVLTDDQSSTPEFTAPLVGPNGETLTFQLQVSDGDLSSTALVNVTIAKQQQAPVAHAKVQNPSVPAGVVVILDGSDSFDPDNDPITYVWTQISGPSVTLSDPTSQSPSFIAPFVGFVGETLTFQLVVTDNCVDTLGDDCSLSSAPSVVTVEVTFFNQPPLADAGASQTVDEGTSVILTGAASSDPDDNALTFLWMAPAEITLDTTDPIHPSFVAPQVPCGGASFGFDLLVDDGFGGMASASVIIHVNNVNNPPLANAGGNQQVAEGAAVVLAGSGTDADGEVLTYAWTQTSGATLSVTGDLTETLEFSAPHLAGGDPNSQEVFEFELKVTDACGASHTDAVTITVVNTPVDPVANAGGSQLVNELANVVLDGSASMDPDGDPLTYQWIQTSGPAVTLQGADTATPGFQAPFVTNAGAALVFQLTVSDPFGGSDTDEVTINVLNINDPPDCSQAAASMAVLWPPNHKLIPISITGIQDPDANHTVRILSVTQDEKVNEIGSGTTSPDAIIQGSVVLLRAERSGTGNGRVYQITFEASDYEGTCTKTVEVTVPHSMAHPAINDGALHDSTQP